MASETCSVGDCDRDAIARELCSSHYGILRRSGGTIERPRYRIICETCGADVLTTRSDTRYCPEHDAPWKRIDRTRECGECGIEFSPKASHAQFCSRLCGQRNHRGRNRVSHSLGQRHRQLKIANTRYRVTERDVHRLRIRQYGECVYCRLVKMLTLDHVIPVSRGGVTSVGNLVLACRRCNSRKGSKTVMEFRKYLREKEEL